MSKNNILFKKKSVNLLLLLLLMNLEKNKVLYKSQNFSIYFTKKNSTFF